jgi:hypothetical protein
MNMESEMTAVVEANPFTERLAKAEDGQDAERVKPGELREQILARHCLLVRRLVKVNAQMLGSAQ